MSDILLTKEECEKRGLKKYEITEIIKESPNIEDYLTADKCKEFKLGSWEIAELIEASGNIEKYLNPKVCEELNIDTIDIVDLIIKSKNEKKYLEPKMRLAFKFYKNDIIDILDGFFKHNDDIESVYELELDHTYIRNLGILYDNLDYILKRENFLDKKNIILKMYQSNREILKADFNILDYKYIHNFGKNNINQIACYPEYIQRMLELSDNDIIVISRCLGYYEQTEKTDEWMQLYSRMMKNISQYEELIMDIVGKKAFNNRDLNKIIKILIHDNIFNITNVNEMRNFEDIERSYLKQWFKKASFGEKVEYICISKYGQTKEEAEEIIKKYESGIERFENENLKYYIKSLQQIFNVKEERTLNRIFYSVEPVKVFNVIDVERLLRDEYRKIYNKGLLKIEEAEKRSEMGDDIYEIPVDDNGMVKNFRIILTSVATYCTNQIEDYWKDWNRKTLGSQHFCTSYISRDMLAKSDIPHLCYGFINMEQDSLRLLGNEDLGSPPNYLSLEDELVKQIKNKVYLLPDILIDSTRLHNEIDFKRVQGGRKKQPDYIVVFRKNGIIPNMDKANKAAMQFKEKVGKRLPIVIVDEDKCLKTEKILLQEMVQKFKEAPSEELYLEIKQKIRNNQQTDRKFGQDIDIGDEPKQVEKESIKDSVEMYELKQAYDEISDVERNDFVLNFKKMYFELSSIREDEKERE